jgi:hypothetical protein
MVDELSVLGGATNGEVVSPFDRQTVVWNSHSLYIPSSTPTITSSEEFCDVLK